MTEAWDIIIVGAGLSGVLAAARLQQRHPGRRILLLDKEATLGGRMRRTRREAGQWSYGFDLVSDELFRYWDQLVRADPEAPDLAAWADRRQESFGVLAAGKISACPVSETFSAKGARALAGAAAARDWTHVDEMLADFREGKAKDQNFGGAWASNRKSPSAVVVEQMSLLMGIPEVWAAPSEMVLARASGLNEPAHLGRWTDAMAATLDRLAATGTVAFKPNAYVASAKREDDTWHLVTESGPVAGRVLVVAQSPWEAIAWLPKIHWPASLLHIALKTKPVSAVVLSQVVVENAAAVPDRLYIPAEEVQVLVNGPHEIVFQATMDYEFSLQAPTVAKAIKRLKRASAKLQAALPALQLADDHLALVPVAWAQPASHSDRRWLEKLGEQGFQGKALGFCGDAYGASFVGDKNSIASVEALCQKLDL